jgi:hypothetical protein
MLNTLAAIRRLGIGTRIEDAWNEFESGTAHQIKGLGSAKFAQLFLECVDQGVAPAEFEPTAAALRWLTGEPCRDSDQGAIRESLASFCRRVTETHVSRVHPLSQMARLAERASEDGLRSVASEKRAECLAKLTPRHLDFFLMGREQLRAI